MISQLIIYLIKENWRGSFSSWMTLLLELFSSSLGLIIYWYASKAFGPSIQEHLDFYQTDFFSFMVVGEIFLGIPIQVLTGLITSYKTIFREHIHEIFISRAISWNRYFISQIIADIWRPFLRMGFIVLVSMGLGLSFSFLSFLYALFLTSLALISFYGFALLALSLINISGRGQTLIFQTNALLGALSGAFFPVEILPSKLAVLMTTIIPHGILLTNVRKILAQTTAIPFPQQEFVHLALLGLAYAGSGYFLFQSSLIFLRKKGRLIL